MSYRYDPYDSSVVIEGFQNGIADNPFDGIADMRSVNIVSVPGEASVNFATQKFSPPTATSIGISSADATTDLLTLTSPNTYVSLGLDLGMAISFSASTVAGVSTGVTYWVGNQSASNTFNIYSDYELTSVVNITSSGTATFSTYNIQKPKANAIGNGSCFMVDSIGQVWSNLSATGTNTYWRYMGNKVPQTTRTAGNGLVYYQASNGTKYLFVFHNSSIDYTSLATISWNYQWNPTAGSVGAYSATPTAILNASSTSALSHEAMVGQDNVVYYCDSSYLGSFFEKRNGPPNNIVFNPLDNTTYTWNYQALSIPAIDNANCLAELGVNLLVGGQRNFVYPWDRTSTSFRYPLLLAESVVSKMVTVNTNTFIFTGNRGRIYITNGSQAQLYKKIPDHISGTIEPYFTWGGVTSTKNQLYFSLSATDNAGTAIAQYGGIWAIDMDTNALRMANKLSYGTYLGYASVLIAQVSTALSAINPAGTGIYAGWDNGASGYGIDQTISTPYTGSQASVDSDLIPIGTFDKPRNATRVEYRLTKPMVSGESVVVKYRLDFSQNYTTLLTDSTATHFSLSKEVNFANAQWIQFQVVLNSTNTTPSYTRLKEIRLVGLVPK